MADQSLFVPLAVFVACVAGSASLILTGRVRRFFLKKGFVDRPNEARKLQQTAKSYGGGTAVLLAAGFAIGVVGVLSARWTADRIDPWPLSGLAVAAVLMWAVGLYDDLYNMRGTNKLLWQFVAACLVVLPGSGLVIEKVAMLGTTISLGYLGIPLAILWILAAINSLNLLDGMDGLASSVGLLFSLTIGVMAICTGRWMEAIVAFALAGSLVGFLRYNWPPASIYLGDSGSMLIGLVLGTLSIRCEVKDAASIAVAAPLAMFAIPLIDSVAAIVRRKFTGRSLYATDRGHIHHRLLTQGLSNKQALYLIGGLCSITCTGAILDVYFREVQFPFGAIAVGVVVLILLSTRIFGNSELSLLNNRLGGLVRRVFPASTPRAASVRLQGTLEWDSVWQGLLDTTKHFNLIHARMSLQLSDLHEDFYASWRSRSRAHSEQRWSVDLPLIHKTQTIGMLNVVGVQDSTTVAPSLIELSELVDELEKQLGHIIDQERERRAGVSTAVEAIPVVSGEAS